MTSNDSLFTLANDGGWWGGSDESFVNGPMAKERASTNPFTFPTGKGHTFRRCRIIPASADEVTFKVEFFDQPFSNTSSLGAGLQSVSDSEYWYYEQTSGSVATQVGLYWEQEGEISDISSVTVAQWDGSQWQDAGQVEVEGDNASGRVTTTDALTTFGYFTFGEKKPNAVLAASGIPGRFKLFQNYPNPFNSTTKIRFNLARKNNVQLEIFNILGQKVLEIKRKSMGAGQHELKIDLNRMASGLYLYRLQAGDHVAIKKMILTK